MPHVDVRAELDDDEQLLVDADEENAGDMEIYLKAVHNRLQQETSKTPERLSGKPDVGDKWLLRLLKSDGVNWWVRKEMAQSICKKLGIEFTYKEYYRDVKVWLPHEKFELEDGMPFCVNCQKNDEVSPHSWRDNHFGRRVTDLKSCYFVNSRRYICHRCELETKRRKEAAKAAGAAAGLSVVDDAESADNPQYTFMGYDARAIERLPFGYGDVNYFPAFLTKRGALDIGVIDMVRPLLNKSTSGGHL